MNLSFLSLCHAFVCVSLFYLKSYYSKRKLTDFLHFHLLQNKIAKPQINARKKYTDIWYHIQFVF